MIFLFIRYLVLCSFIFIINKWYLLHAFDTPRLIRILPPLMKMDISIHISELSRWGLQNIVDVDMISTTPEELRRYAALTGHISAVTCLQLQWPDYFRGSTYISPK